MVRIIIFSIKETPTNGLDKKSTSVQQEESDIHEVEHGLDAVIGDRVVP